jgi:Tfp pilus assembly protein PilW
MQAKRRSPVRGPLLTLALMIGSVVAVGAIEHYLDVRQKAAEQTVSASDSDSSHQSTRQ